MILPIILSAIAAGSLSTVTVAKDYLKSEPLLAGSLIEYCEKSTPDRCSSIDRRQEKLGDVTKLLTEVPSKLAEIYPEFSSLTVQFPNSAKEKAGFDLKFSSKLGNE